MVIVGSSFHLSNNSEMSNINLYGKSPLIIWQSNLIMPNTFSLYFVNSGDNSFQERKTYTYNELKDLLADPKHNHIV